VVTEQLTKDCENAPFRHLAFLRPFAQSSKTSPLREAFPMTDFAAARRTMVDGQVRVNDVTDAAVISAMLEVPREKFVPSSRAELAYIDEDLCVLEGKDGKPARYLMEPMVLAKLLQALELTSESKVLDVGCATGYSTAVLSRIAGSVVGLEQDEVLSANAAKFAKASNVSIATGKSSQGWAAGAPYDAILINGSVEEIPQALQSQLKDGGRLAAVIRKDGAPRAMLYVRTGEHLSSRRLFDAAIPHLPGFEATKGFVF